MSSITIASLPRLSRESLASRLLSSPEASSSVAIIDVRGSDYIGGHIRGCVNVPSSDLDWRTPELVRTLKDKDMVVFHCALSQQRGPAAALRYLRERERLLGASGAGVDTKQTSGLEKEEQDGAKEGVGKSKGQEVYILDGGFVKWQEKYGEDEKLTENYKKDIWEFGY
ncbi:Rhodanese-like protein [Rhizodiscina lignyota]|uniref:Rhodanese-like protein n=1 Tax=Rhizodiscina lignyota TaxID=1504668 RepID=A0A9P4II64_9PEZI|nr:Rhodanese-like protein [Rhizodiscina lignyota]